MIRSRWRPGSPVALAGDASAPRCLTPGLAADLDALVEPETRGDPMNPLRWTTKSLSHLVGQLRARASVHGELVARLLHEAGYSLQANAKTVRGPPAPRPRRAVPLHQRQVTAALAAGEPVISVDTKKKELVGNYKNGGREWRPAGDPEVSVHDFPGPDGQGHPLRRLRHRRQHRLGDRRHRPRHRRVRREHPPHLVEQAGPRRLPRRHDADWSPLTPAASNGYRLRAWKIELAAFAAETGLQSPCCHLPPGTSKWNGSSTGCSPRSP